MVQSDIGTYLPLRLPRPAADVVVHMDPKRSARTPSRKPAVRHPLPSLLVLAHQRQDLLEAHPPPQRAA